MDQEKKFSDFLNSLSNFDSYKYVITFFLIGIAVRLFIYNSKSKPKRKLGVVTDVIVYPVKSCMGIHLDSSKVGPKGLLFDRLYMLCYPNGNK
jgi:hypothetical protein